MMHLVVALGAEARPLVEHFGLEPVEAGGGAYRSFRSEHVSLVVSGIGKLAAASATAYLQEKTSEKSHGVWLNVGIAGQRDRAPGDLVRAHTIADAASGERYYPTLLGLTHLETARVTSVEATETQFLTEDFYEMEASGFYRAALGFSTAELVQCLKIASDNRETGTAHLSKESVAELIASRLETIEELLEHLREIAEETPFEGVHADELARFRSAWHFTTTEARQLTRLLGRYRTCDPGRVPTSEGLRDCPTSADVLREIERRVQALALEREGY